MDTLKALLSLEQGENISPRKSTLGIALYHNGAVKDAMKIFNSTLMESTDNKSPDILALCYTGLGRIYRQRGDIDEALVKIITTNHWKVTEAVIMMRAK